MVFLSSRISPLHVHRDLLVELAAGDGGRHFGDVADLRVRLPAIEFTLSVRSFQVPPTPGYARLTAQLPFGAHLARHAGHLGGERAQLVHHGVDGVLELENLALHVHRDLLGQVAVRHRGRHFGDVAHLRREVAGHQVHVVGEVLPGPADARHLGLTAQLAFGAHLARHAGHF